MTNPIHVNMALKSHEFFYIITAALPGKQSISRTTVVTVPYLTNTCDLKKGDILTMQVADTPEKEKKAKRGRNWETDARNTLNKEKLKEKKEAAPSGSTRRRCAEDSDVMGAFAQSDEMFL